MNENEATNDPRRLLMNLGGSSHQVWCKCNYPNHHL